MKRGLASILALSLAGASMAQDSLSVLGQFQADLKAQPNVAGEYSTIHDIIEEEVPLMPSLFEKRELSTEIKGVKYTWSRQDPRPLVWHSTHQCDQYRKKEDRLFRNRAMLYGSVGKGPIYQISVKFPDGNKVTLTAKGNSATAHSALISGYGINETTRHREKPDYLPMIQETFDQGVQLFDVLSFEGASPQHALQAFNFNAREVFDYLKAELTD